MSTVRERWRRQLEPLRKEARKAEREQAEADAHALAVGCPMCQVPIGERCRTSERERERPHLSRVAAARDVVVEPLPEPMPAHNAAGERVYLHYRPLRWERHP